MRKVEERERQNVNSKQDKREKRSRQVKTPGDRRPSPGSGEKNVEEIEANIETEMSAIE